jgi:hypothetical protein
MQKSLIAIALALTLSSAFAAYTATNYVKAPQPVAADNETNFTNGNLSLASIQVGGVYLVSQNFTANPNNVSAGNYNIWYKQLDAKALTAGTVTTTAIVAPATVNYYNNYAWAIAPETANNITNLYVYQLPLMSGTTGPARLQLTNYTANNTYTPLFQTFAPIGKTVYVAYVSANQTVTVTNFFAGTSTVGTPFTLTTSYDTLSTLSLTWGEALGSNQLLAVWKENGALKDSVLDVSKGTAGTPTVIQGYNDTLHKCAAYVTDKKQYGEVCYATNATANTTTYWVRSTANSTLVPYATYTTNTNMYNALIPYGQYIAVMFTDSTAATGTNFAYEIWDLDAYKNFRNRTQYLNIDSNSTQAPYRVPSGGYYTLLYNKPQGNATSVTMVQVGLLLGSSYLASVLSFLLTIVAGLLLF